MVHQVVQLKCPSCGAPVAVNQKVCEYCENSVIVITNYETVAAMSTPKVAKFAESYKEQLKSDSRNPQLNLSVAFCHMKRKLYDEAVEAFKKVIEVDYENAEAYFSLAVCTLKGQKPFCLSRPIINKAIEYLNAAIEIDGKGIYYYFLAYIRYDYFARKYLNIKPDYKDALLKAKQTGYTQREVQQLFMQLGVERPSAL